MEQRPTLTKTREVVLMKKLILEMINESPSALIPSLKKAGLNELDITDALKAMDSGKDLAKKLLNNNDEACTSSRCVFS